MIRPLRATPRPLHDALERYIALSEVALRACDENDAEGVHIALDARDVLGARVAELSAPRLTPSTLRYAASASIFSGLLAPVPATPATCAASTTSWSSASREAEPCRPPDRAPGSGRRGNHRVRQRRPRTLARLDLRR